MPAFVVLEHVKDADRHFDLMLEQGRVLLTFSFAEFPASPATCRRLFDHRLAYLELEGEIEEGKGRVARVESGRFDLLNFAPDSICVHLRGERLQGVFHLTQVPGAGEENWKFAAQEKKGSGPFGAQVKEA
jgi:hypothetical protein